MRTKILFFVCVLFSILSGNAQTPICKIDTTGWKRIPTTSVNIKTIQQNCRYFYNTNTNLMIWFDTCTKNISGNNDLQNYNSIDIYYGNGAACDITMKYDLYVDGNGQPILIINVFVPEVRCKAMSGLEECFLVKKEDCPIKPKVCIIQHQIDCKWLKTTNNFNAYEK